VETAPGKDRIAGWESPKIGPETVVNVEVCHFTGWSKTTFANDTSW